MREDRFFMISFTAACVLPFCAVSVMAQTHGTSNIRAVDFQNFSYRPTCSYDAKPLRTHNGEYTRARGDDKIFFKIKDPKYGDLNGDGKDEAVVTSVCNTGGTGNFTEGFVYTMRGGRPILLTRIEGGDRAFGGIDDARIEQGLLLVERYAPDESGGGACCPKYIETTKYRWNGQRLVQIGKTTRRRYTPR